MALYSTVHATQKTILSIAMIEIEGNKIKGDQEYSITSRYDTVQAKTDIWVSGYFTLFCMELAPLACRQGNDRVTYVSPLTCTTREALKAPTI